MTLVNETSALVFKLGLFIILIHKRDFMVTLAVFLGKSIIFIAKQWRYFQQWIREIFYISFIS